MPNRDPLPPDSPQPLQLNLAFRGPGLKIHPRPKMHWVYLGCSCSQQVAPHHWKKKKPRNSADSNHHIGWDQLLPQQPPSQKNRGALHSPARSRVGHCGHHRFWYLRYQETQNHHCACEKSPTPLTSNDCAMQKASAKPRETWLTAEPRNILLLHTDLASNSLTFSDLLSACSFTSPRLCAAPARNQSKQNMLRYCPKPPPAHTDSHLLLCYLGCSPTLPLPFTTCHVEAQVPPVKYK